jgi:hypothetical protein
MLTATEHRARFMTSTLCAVGFISDTGNQFHTLLLAFGIVHTLRLTII